MELNTKKDVDPSIKDHINANYVLVELDPQQNILFLNGFGERLFGLKVEDIKGKNIKGTIIGKEDDSTIIGKEDDSFTKKIHEIINEDKPPLDNYFEYKHNIKSKNKKDTIYISWVFSLGYNEDGSLEKIVCIGSNIAKNIESQRDKMSEFEEDILKKERNRLANEIHDTVSQTLFSLNLLCSNLSRLWEKGKKDKFYNSLKSIEKLGNTVFSELRILLYELKPEKIEDENLKTLIRRISDTNLSKSKIDISFKAVEEYSYPYDVKFSVFRICQQAFNNIKKHSQARNVSILLHSDVKKLSLNIKDDGVGFYPEKISSGSFGLNIMRERARMIDAKLDIFSMPEQGTEINFIYLNNHGKQ
jgi:signal transduction histidine kinase